MIYGGSICEKIGVGVVVFFFFLQNKRRGKRENCQVLIHQILSTKYPLAIPSKNNYNSDF